MEWIERLNSAIEYIEENLEDDVDLDRLAMIACCSTFHFQRMFSYIANVPLSEYIRRRRMTKAAFDLQNGDDKVIDIALKYGYSSPTAFNRAFQNMHGVSPSQARAKGTIIKAFPPISFTITIKGDVEMNYRIEQKDSFRIVGIGEALHKDIEKNFEIVPKMWGAAAANGTIEGLLPLMNAEPMGVLGVSACFGDDNWRYYIAVASDKSVDDKLEEYTVPASTWAIFYGEGSMPDSIQELEKRIVTEWLPTSGYEYGNAPDIELYMTADPQNAKFEVWLPVVKK